MNDMSFYTMMMTAVALYFLAIHISLDKSLSNNSRKWFACAACILGTTAVIECICSSSSTLARAPLFFELLIMVEIIIQPFTCAAQCYACEMKKMGKIAIISCAVYACVISAAYFTGLLISISAEGEYSTGPLLVLTLIFEIMHSTYTLAMLIILSRKYRKEGSVTLALICILFILSSVGSFISGYDSVGLVTASFGFFMLYTYYTSLCSKIMTEKIKADEELLEQFSLQTMQSLANAIDAKDKYTNGHSHRVSEYSVLLARELGWDEERIKYLKYAGLMHDIGKIGIPDSVLNKAGRLTDMEANMMKAHTVLGSEIAAEVTAVPDAYHAARSHHERYDGKGYPDGLSGDGIPEIARVIAVADTFDAMNSDRIYRKALPKQVIMEELRKGSGTQFDPEFVDRFVKIYDAGMMDEIASEGRMDMAKYEELDPFSAFVKDVFEYFYISYEFTGEWQEEFTQWGKLNHYIKTLTTEMPIEYDMLVISIHAADGRIVEESQQEKAVRVMIDCVTAYTKRDDICAKISKTQIAIIFRRDSGIDISQTMQQIFLYFYKIFESGAFSINYKLINADAIDD